MEYMCVFEVDDDEMVAEYYYPSCSSINTQNQMEIMAPQQEVVVKAQGGRKKKKKKNRDEEDEGIISIRKMRKQLSEEQVNVLEESFRHEYKLDTERKHRLASQLDIDPRQVAVWFQNRRARWKTNNLEHHYLHLKTQHHATLENISQLQTQVLKLKAELNDAQNLLHLNTPTTSSSFSRDPAGEFVLGGLETLFHSPQINHHHHGFESLP